MPSSYDRELLFGRMIGIVSSQELELLSGKTVAVPGCGGVGFTHAEALVRMGVGGVKIADFDEFGPENFNRQFGATIHTIGKKKTDVLVERLKSINSEIAIQAYDGVTERSVSSFLSNVDIVCDAMDYFVIAPRRLMYAEAKKRGIPVVISGPIGFGATSHLFDPDGMSFDEYFDLRDGQSEEEMLKNFGVGLNPSELHRYYLPDPKLDFESKKVSSVSSSCLLATTLSTSIAMAKLLDSPIFFKPVPYIYQIDYVCGKFIEQHIPGGVKAIKSDPEKYRS